MTTGEKTKYNYEDESSEFSSELEEVYEQFSKWLDDPIIKENVDKLDPRDEAVVNFASSLLKRTLSESFVGVPLTEGCISSACKCVVLHIFQTKCNKSNFPIDILRRYSSRREFNAKLSR